MAQLCQLAPNIPTPPPCSAFAPREWVGEWRIIRSGFMEGQKSNEGSPGFGAAFPLRAFENSGMHSWETEHCSLDCLVGLGDRVWVQGPPKGPSELSLLWVETSKGLHSRSKNELERKRHCHSASNHFILPNLNLRWTQIASAPRHPAEVKVNSLWKVAFYQTI